MADLQLLRFAGMCPPDRSPILARSTGRRLDDVVSPPRRGHRL